MLHCLFTQLSWSMKQNGTCMMKLIKSLYSLGFRFRSLWEQISIVEECPARRMLPVGWFFSTAAKKHQILIRVFMQLLRKVEKYHQIKPKSKTISRLCCFWFRFRKSSWNIVIKSYQPEFLRNCRKFSSYTTEL